MKKLIVALGAVALAVSAQAATVRWNSGTIYAPASATGTSSTTARDASITAYLYTFSSLDAYNAAKAKDVVSLYNEYVKGGKEATATASSNAGGQANIQQAGAADGSTDSPVDVYGMVLYVDTATAASYDGVDAFVKAGFAADLYKDTTGLTFGNLGTQQTAWTAVGQSVPEPTSGLLLLLGMAGLALKRKRA